MRVIPLTKGKEAIVDNAAYPWLSQFNWHLAVGQWDKMGYAARRIRVKKQRFYIFMHHVILPRIKGHEIDHINRNTLDNRKENLRYVTHAQNCAHLRGRPPVKTHSRS
jgi:HNH endonuclease